MLANPAPVNTTSSMVHLMVTPIEKKKLCRLASPAPVDTTSSMVYLMMTVSLTRYPLEGSSRMERFTNFR